MYGQCPALRAVLRLRVPFIRGSVFGPRARPARRASPPAARGPPRRLYGSSPRPSYPHKAAAFLYAIFCSTSQEISGLVCGMERNQATASSTFSINESMEKRTRSSGSVLLVSK